MSRTVRKRPQAKAPRVLREGWQVAKAGMPRAAIMASRVHGQESNRTARRKAVPAPSMAWLLASGAVGVMRRNPEPRQFDTCAN